MCFVGIAADSRCDYRFNVDFVHFTWDNFERFSTRKFAITILPSDNVTVPLYLSSALPSNTKVVYFKYYRTLSDGLCLDKRNCNQCLVKNRLSLHILCCCRRYEGDCLCIACKGQPPSLRDICSDKYFRDIRHFTFTTSTTFNQYVDAVVSGRVPWELPLAPGFPSILISFSYNSFDAKFHHTCPGIMSWHGQISRTFELDSDAILELADETQKNTFWCSACHRGLFFPNTCQFHPH